MGIHRTYSPIINRSLGQHHVSFVFILALRLQLPSGFP